MNILASFIYCRTILLHLQLLVLGLGWAPGLEFSQALSKPWTTQLPKAFLNKICAQIEHIVWTRNMWWVLLWFALKFSFGHLAQSSESPKLRLCHQVSFSLNRLNRPHTHTLTRTNNGAALSIFLHRTSSQSSRTEGSFAISLASSISCSPWPAQQKAARIPGMNFVLLWSCQTSNWVSIISCSQKALCEHNMLKTWHLQKQKPIKKPFWVYSCIIFHYHYSIASNSGWSTTKPTKPDLHSWDPKPLICLQIAGGTSGRALLSPSPWANRGRTTIST